MDKLSTSVGVLIGLVVTSLFKLVESEPTNEEKAEIQAKREEIRGLENGN